MRILQGNIHRSRLADDLLTQIKFDLNIDLFIISEQYLNKDHPGWWTDTLGTAAIWTPDTRAVPVEECGSRPGFVWVRTTGITLVSCYFTPNENIANFEDKLDDLEDTIRGFNNAVLVAGDFNAKAVEWGMPTTNSRGRRVLEMASRLGLIVINSGNVSTFRRPGYGETIPDITFASESIAMEVQNWKVLEDYTASDHQYILYDVIRSQRRNVRNSKRPLRWNLAKLNREVLTSEIDRGKEKVLNLTGGAEKVMEATMHLIRQACDAAMPRKYPSKGRKTPAYWWTEEIANLRKKCLNLRRRVTRARRRIEEIGGTSIDVMLEEYRLARKQLKSAINSSKRLKWEALKQDVEADPWGMGYKIVLKKLGSQSPSPVMSPMQMTHIVDTLFPCHPERIPEVLVVSPENVPLFTELDLEMAVDSLRAGKAPGPDGIPAEVLKVIARSCPRILLAMYNRCLMEGIFPTRWKVQKLVLISKGKSNSCQPSSYRPLCMLDTAGKLLELLIKPRLIDAVQADGDLSDKQYGFRKGRSTVGAVSEVTKAFLMAQRGNHYSRKMVLLAALDIRNAFNSARWSVILRALREEFRTPDYLFRILQSYLSGRKLLYETSEGSRWRNVTGGAAQGSILGPDLWNVSYDGILKVEMPEDTFLVAYADDIAAVIVARDTEDAQRRLNQVMRRVTIWLEENGLSLAPEKTELLLLTRRRIQTSVQFQMESDLVSTKDTVKYLGIHLDSRLSFWRQICKATEKAAKVTSSLSGLMKNIGGPTAGKRKLLMSVSDAILLYGCEVWASALKKEKYRRQMAAVQRRGALRIASSYRTVSEPAVLAVAGVMPIDIKAEERKRVYETKDDLGAYEARVAARDIAMQQWQDRWYLETRGRWTAWLVGDLAEWVGRRHGEVNYFITQLLTGHGYFCAYLNRMGKMNDPSCIFGDSSFDDAYHTFFVCERWAQDRYDLEGVVGAFSPDNIVRLMLTSQRSWTRIASYIESILRRKKIELDRVIR